MTDGDHDQDRELDDDYLYAGYRLGRVRTETEVDAEEGTHTFEEGVLVCEPVEQDTLEQTREDEWWSQVFVAPDGGVGFGTDGGSGGAVVAYDLAAIVEFPSLMTEKEADEWLPDNWLEAYPAVDVPGIEWYGDEPAVGQPEITSEQTAADLYAEVSEDAQ